MTVGGNFKRLREARKLTQEQVYKQLGYKRPSNVSIMENSARLPKPGRIRRMATVLNVGTWELLEGVETEYDRLRSPGKLVEMEVAEKITARPEFPRTAAADRKRERLAAANQDRRLKARR